jgi:hypothetical protein
VAGEEEESKIGVLGLRYEIIERPVEFADGQVFASSQLSVELSSISWGKHARLSALLALGQKS